MNRVNTAAKHFRPEILLLLCCARTEVGATEKKRIRELVQGSMDWGYLIETSFSHHVFPLLYRNLITICPEAMPRSICTQLTEWFQSHVRHNLVLTHELLRLLRLLKDMGITALPYKGPVLAASVYGDVSLRSFGDLDILVDKLNILTAKRLLLADGYDERSPTSNEQEKARLRSKNEKDLTLIGPGGFIHLELHWQLANLSLFPLETRKIWARLESLCLGGSEVLNLSPEDLLLVLCVHGAKHSFRRLEWVCDIAETIKRYPGIQWDRVIEHARRLRTKRMLFFGLSIASELLGAELPSEVLLAIKSDRQAGLLSERAQAALFRDRDSTAEVLRRNIDRIGLREACSDRLRMWLYYCWDYVRAVLKPNEEDRRHVRLPVFLSFLYVLLRPVRLARLYGVSWFVNKRRAKQQ